MRVVYGRDQLAAYIRELYGAEPMAEVETDGAPVLIDRFLEGAVEVDVDAVFDGRELLIGGVMEHIEEAGVHSGDSACVVPPPTLGDAVVKQIEDYTDRIARALEVCGLLNIQFAVRGDKVFLLEVNPRASRTVPFISKATAVPLAKVATWVMTGTTLRELRDDGVLPARATRTGFVAVKEAVMPWSRFPAEDVVLGPEMRATGEVMGLGRDLESAYAKALLAAGHRLPTAGTVFFSLADRDKPLGIVAASTFTELGFRLLATEGTATFLAGHGLPATRVDKVGEGPWDPVRLIDEGKVDLVVNTPQGRRASGDGRAIRRAAYRAAIPCITTVQGGLAVARSLSGGIDRVDRVRTLQEYHR